MKEGRFPTLVTPAHASLRLSAVSRNEGGSVSDPRYRSEPGHRRGLVAAMKEGRFPTLVTDGGSGQGTPGSAAMKEGRFPTLVVQEADIDGFFQKPQ